MKNIFIYFFLWLLLFLSSFPPSPCLLEERGETGHRVNRHTELLWCWLCFPNIFSGLFPFGEWSIYPFLFPHCSVISETLMMGVLGVLKLVAAETFTDHTWSKDVLLESGYLFHSSRNMKGRYWSSAVLFLPDFFFLFCVITCDLEGYLIRIRNRVQND